MTADALADRGVPVRIVDTGHLRDVARGIVEARLRPVSLHVFNVSSVRSLSRAATLRSLVGHRSVVYLHALDASTEWTNTSPRSRTRLVRKVGRFDRFWVTNATLAAALGYPRRRALEVSPFPNPPPTRGPSSPDAEPPGSRSPRAIVGAYGGQQLYGVDLAVEAVRRCRKSGMDLDLAVLLYGPDSPERRAVGESLDGYEWITVYEDLDAPVVAGLLSTCTILLRPTERDGDSLLVREALGLGLRVIASDPVPRPAGVELAARNAGSFADAILGRGIPSDGAGLGLPIDHAILAVLDE